jgi:NAD(P)-dependent dehydrogenase (short-subunit alcohol dehydrogenase family)
MEELPRILVYANEISGGVDILINNASVVARLGPIRTVDPAKWANANVMTPEGSGRLLLSHLDSEDKRRVWELSDHV